MTACVSPGRGLWNLNKLPLQGILALGSLNNLQLCFAHHFKADSMGAFPETQTVVFEQLGGIGPWTMGQGLKFLGGVIC